MFMLNQLEKLDAIEQAKVASRLLADHADELQDFLKALYNYVGKTTPRRTVLAPRKDSTFALRYFSLWGPSANTGELVLEPEQVQEWLERLFLNMVQTGAEESRMYTTGQLAKFFGVSVQTINQWIAQGRIQPVIKEGPFKHARIPETATYTTSLGEVLTIADIVDMYEEEIKTKQLNPDATEEDVLEDLRQTNAFFEQKYNGSFEETLGRKLVSEMTDQEQRDHDEWEYVVTRLRSGSE
jgi:hypothetical protein